MEKAKVIFQLEGVNIAVLCSIKDKMKDICQKFSIKVEKNINSLVFLYGGNQLNFNLSFREQANSLDKERREMQVLVYTNELDNFICPKCGEKIKLNTEKIDNIILSINTIRDTLNGAKLLIDNIIKNSSLNSVNMQLKSVNLILNSINDEIIKSNEKLKNLLNENQFKNIIKGELYIKQEELNNKIVLFNSDIKNKIDVFLNNQKINMIKNNNKWIIDCHFKNEGKYSFEIHINNNITSLNRFFEDCSNIISLDLSNIDTSNVSDMYRMFHNCNQLKEIKGWDVQCMQQIKGNSRN
jgi:surface protein